VYKTVSFGIYKVAWRKIYETSKICDTLTLILLLLFVLPQL